jgi:origin recognition complex subunit 1
VICYTHNYSALHLCRCCSKMEQLFLQAVTAEIQRTGVEETVFEQVYVQLRTLCTFDGK